MVSETFREERDTVIAHRVFSFVVAHPWTFLLIGLVLAAAMASQLPKTVKDTTIDAFLPAGHPALLYRDKVEDIFGLRDPIIVAVVDEGENAIFDVESLALVDWLTERIRALPNVDPERITSLATEKKITGTPEGLFIEPFFETPPNSAAEATAVGHAARAMPLYDGSLVARDGSATLIVAELLDQDIAGETYAAVMALADEAPPGGVLHVAGEGATSGYLGDYIDRDARRLQPIAFVIIVALMWVAFRSLAGVGLPIIVILAAAGGSLGIMAGIGVPYYAITNALPVILIGIAVADSIHILNTFYEERARAPERQIKATVVRAMCIIWRPVVLTSLTTMAGFLGIVIASDMPPMVYFALFAMLGVFIAMVYSLLLLPAGLVLIKPKTSPAFHPNRQGESHDIFARAMGRIGQAAIARAPMVIGLGAVVMAVGLLGASRLEVDRAQINQFKESEPIHIADDIINERFDGTNFLDIVIETEEIEGLFDPARLERIDALQRYLETLPHVQGTVSIVDYLKQLNESINDGDPAFYRLPADRDVVAQFFLLYSASSDPTDLEEEIDHEYRRALVRTLINDGHYSVSREIVKAARDYLENELEGDGLTASLTGRVNIDYHWLEPLARSHFLSVAISLALVWLMSSVLLRSPMAGLFTLAPVALAVLLVYAAMGFFGIWLDVATSIFAAIAIGLGIDFAIHIVDRLRHFVVERGMSERDAMTHIYPTAGRALFFNFACLFFGFGVLAFSELPTLTRFGALVAVAVCASFLWAVIFLPALVKLVKPKFFSARRDELTSIARSATPGLALLSALAIAFIASPAHADEAAATTGPESVPAATAGELTGEEIAARVDGREDGDRMELTMRMRLIDRQGATRERMTRLLRRDFGEVEKLLLFFEAPTNIQGTGFLTFDYGDGARADDQWLYLPALRRTRRISASDRGDYFLGTDFTYEDIKDSTKFSLEDYAFTRVGRELHAGVNAYVVEAVPVSEEIARELGYSRTLAHVHPDIWLPLSVDYWDVGGNLLKTISFHDIEKIEGIWTARRIRAQNHKTGHMTEFIYESVTYASEIEEDLFTEQTLRLGLY